MKLLNNPAGYVSSTVENDGPTVKELLPPELRTKNMFPAGRLDKESLGALLLAWKFRGNPRRRPLVALAFLLSAATVTWGALCGVWFGVQKGGIRLLADPAVKDANTQAFCFILAVAQLYADRAGLHRLDGFQIVVPGPVPDYPVGLWSRYDDARAAGGALGLEAAHVKRGLDLASARGTEEAGEVFFGFHLRFRVSWRCATDSIS